MFDMMGMMGKVKEMQSKMQEAQEKLGDLTFEAESGAGMVKVKLNGRKELLSVEIEPALLNANDAKILQDLIVAAVNMGLKEADEKAKSEMAKYSEDLLPKIPGMDLGSLFKK